MRAKVIIDVEVDDWLIEDDEDLEKGIENLLVISETSWITHIYSVKVDKGE